MICFEYTACVLSGLMTPSDTLKLIEAAGGKEEFAALLKIDSDKYRKQKLWNWSSRGLSRKAMLEHYQTLVPLAKRAKVQLA